MTFLAGIICKDGVVIAADGQTTLNDRRESTTAKKISILESQAGPVLVAQSGAGDYANEAVRIFTNKLMKATISDSESVVNVAVDAVRTFRDEHARLYPDALRSATNWHGYFLEEGKRFLLMFGYCFEGRSHLYKIEPASCIGLKPLSFFHTAGIGADLGTFLLREYAQADMPIALAGVVAIYAMHKVNEDSIYCSGQTQVGIVRNVWAGFTASHRTGNSAQLLSDVEVNDLQKLVVDADREAKQDMAAKVMETLKTARKKLLRMTQNPNSRYRLD